MSHKVLLIPFVDFVSTPIIVRTDGRCLEGWGLFYSQCLLDTELMSR